MTNRPANRPYVGFWNRTAAALIDSVLLLVVTLPLQQVLTGAALDLPGERPTGFWDIIVGYVLPAAAILVFWKYRSATPGKMFMGAEIVDASTGGKPTNRQLVLRYVGYYLSTLPLLLGLVWVALDPRKQGWHDKLAGTLVVSKAPGAAGSRYAPTSALTYLICGPVLLLLIALVVMIFAIGLDPASLRALDPVLG
jgi:uncharacterized RDD family membrane protein YckC